MPAGEFTNNPAGAGFRYFFQRSLREQLRAEIHAQFQKFRATGLPLDHVNGHLHLHLHPTVFRILMDDAGQLGIKRLRLTFDPFRLNLRLASGHSGLSRARTPLIFHPLSARARPVLAGAASGTPAPSSACCRTRAWTKPTSRACSRACRAGDSELYSHPSLDEFKHEFDALISPRVQEQVEKLGIQLIRYQDL